MPYASIMKTQDLWCQNTPKKVFKFLILSFVLQVGSFRDECLQNKNNFSD
uniref:Uncharacterized protein n=1 Tax=Moniliophthora roreri TaxID=221103 RepID=A0A0W0G7F5_MONRR